MLVTTILVTLLSAVASAVAVPAAPVANPKSSGVDKREAQWDVDPSIAWRVSCPSTRIWQWRGNLVNWNWCQDRCDCRGKFVKVHGDCKYEKFLECYQQVSTTACVTSKSAIFLVKLPEA
ncbi:uncharacterized protein DFL_003447 [Arthrobotrys flagrans]|uniref:Uncharacterized protein n=1 Tax=Arthrobotrys flagrans TaxID=97331 RepID=A0A437A1U6_ARTFL|nr:hypothetical protein DFL_003447 [Arthrobotrys flagrans]